MRNTLRLTKRRRTVLIGRVAGISLEVTGRWMSRPELNSTRTEAKATEVVVDAVRTEGQNVRDGAAGLRAGSRLARRHAAEVRHEANALLDAVALLVTDVLRRHGFALLAPVVARFRMNENGSTGVAVAVRLEDPSHADAAQAAIVERFPDRLSEVVVK
jgi:hypothetical protein